jgi:hypothetical protein
MSDAENMRAWLLKNYPVEGVFIDAITKNVNDIFQRLSTHNNFQPDTPKDMRFQVIKRSETDYVELQMTSDAVLFMGGMAKAISDIILKQLLPNIEPETKKCSNCKTTNNEIANYCYQCGNKFESI